MWTSLAVVLALLVGTGAVLKGVSYLQRRKALGVIPPDEVQHALNGVSLRVETRGRTTLPGMNSGRANRTRGDLVVGDDRFVLASARGRLVDIRPGSPRLSSVRSPGPGRLVLEGTSGLQGAEGPPGAYRIELVVEDATRWVEILTPYADSTVSREGPGGQADAEVHPELQDSADPPSQARDEPPESLPMNV